MDRADLNAEELLEALGYSVLCFRDDRTLSILYASGSFYRLLGYREGEIQGLRLPSDNPVLRNEIPIDWRQVKAEIETKGYACPELRLIKKNGHHIWAAYRVRLCTKGGGADCFCGIAEDITLTRRSLRQQREQAEELKALTENVPGGVLCSRGDKFMTLSLISDGFCRITGYTRAEIQSSFGNRFLNMIYPKDREAVKKQLENCVCRNDTAEMIYRVLGRDGQVIWFLDKTRRTTDCNGHYWFYSVLIDVTAWKKAQDELAASEERYRLILEHMETPVFDCDLKTGRLYYSPAFQKKFGGGFPTSGDVLELLKSRDFVLKEDREPVFRSLNWLKRGESVKDEEYRIRSAEGNYIWCSVHPAMFFDEQGVPARLIAVITDIDRQKKENLVLREKAEHDLLTGLYNHITTKKLIEQAIAASREGERHAFFVIDIDNFKRVNDTWGHLCGDQLIELTAAQIRKRFREDDIIGRVGGDEFVIFLKDVSSRLILEKARILQRMFAGLRKSYKPECGITGSIGVSIYPIDGTTYEELFRKADAAMYAAKKHGKNTFRIYTKKDGDLSLPEADCGF
jgi:diguanylate cyclase (GGDEF)-like protein/PAS domain S-box-containing protein